jgi:ABC-type ATPase with predicted acetyltransferase domain
VLITGPSGAGKSTLLRAAEAALRARSPRRPRLRIQRLEQISLTSRLAIIDTFDAPLERALEMLSRAGLAEPRLWLRRPCELSEGQQFRYRLARFMAGAAHVLIADEFTATLDRTTARIIAWQLGRFIRDSAAGGLPRAAMVATSHADLEEDLHPTRVLRIAEGTCTLE